MKKFFSSKTRSKKLFAFLAAAVVALGVLCPMAIYALEYLPDNDPIITLSYLKDILLPQTKEELKAELKDELLGELRTEFSEQLPQTYVGYTVLELARDTKLTSQEGTVELIVRPGSSAVVVSDIPENGLSDISEMKEVLAGDEVGINHLLIIPRNDGRGIVITSETAYVLVRGNYKTGD